MCIRDSPYDCLYALFFAAPMSGHRQGGPGITQESSTAQFTRTEPVDRLNQNHERLITMLYTIAVVLLILWLLGLVTSYTLGGFIHVLLVIAIVVVLLRVISGRHPLGHRVS